MTQVHLAQRVKPVARPRRRYGSQIRKVAILIISVLAGLVIWQVLSWQFGPALVASPAETAEAAFALLIDGTLWEAITASSYRILLGWLLGVAVGAPLGLLMGRIAVIRELAEPYIEFFRFIPPIAFVTLAVVWFGLGETSKIVLIVYTTLFMVAINTMIGVLGVEPDK